MIELIIAWAVEFFSHWVLFVMAAFGITIFVILRWAIDSNYKGESDESIC